MKSPGRQASFANPVTEEAWENPPVRVRRAWMAALFVAAVALRVAGNASFFFKPIESGSRNFEMFDSTYHLRRVFRALESYPRVSSFDTYHYYPDNPPVPWPPGYDWLLATILKPFQIAGLSRTALETLLGAVPCVLDAVSVLLFVFFFGRYLPWPTAAAAGLLMALSTQNTTYSEIGYIDHHYFITFLTAVYCVLLYRFDRQCLGPHPYLSSIRQTAGGRRREFSANLPRPLEERERVGVRGILPYGPAAALGAALGAGPFFNVSVIQYVLLFLFVVGLRTWRDRSLPEAWRAAAIVFGAALAASFLSALSTPAGRQFQIRYDVTSMFQFYLILFACSALALAALWLFPSTRIHRYRQAGTALLLVALAALGWRVHGDMEEGARFLLTSNPLNWIQVEERSILHYGADWGTLYTWFVFILPAGLWAFWKDRSEQPFFSATAAVFFAYGALTGLSHFLYLQYFFPWFALICATGFTFLLRRWRRRGHVFRLGFAGILFAQLGWKVWNGQIIRPASLLEARAGFEDTIRTLSWLGAHSAATAHWERGDGPPEYSVFASRDHGHQIVRVARRAVVVSPFTTPDFLGHMKDYARVTITREEADAWTLLKKYRARYWILDNRDNTSIPFFVRLLGGEPDLERYRQMARASHAMYAVRNNLFLFDGELRWNKTPAIQHFRLLYESPRTIDVPIRVKDRVVDQNVHAMKIFEAVEGAVVTGGGFAPGSRVVFKLPLRTNTGREIAYTSFDTADAGGRIQLTLAYPSEPLPDSAVVPTKPAYEVLPEKGRPRTLAVTESQVSSGQTLHL